jgi:transcriptional regulator with XRE-family HTH domain
MRPRHVPGLHPLLVQLRRARLMSGISTEILAPEVGVSRAAISHWETGRKEPTLDHLCAYARAVGYEITIIKIAEKEVSTWRPPGPTS